MDTLELLGSALGLGFLAGIRLYLTVFLVGLGIRFGWLDPQDGFAHLSVLADSRVLIVAGLASAVEFFADKVPWIDTAWDAIHTFIRPVGAALIGMSAFGAVDPATKVAVLLLSGGIALSAHSTKAATRVMANHSPEPVSNAVLSTMGDILVPAGLWAVASHPLIVLGIVTAFVLLFLWCLPKIVRLLRRPWNLLMGKLRGGRGEGPAVTPVP